MRKISRKVRKSRLDGRYCSAGLSGKESIGVVVESPPRASWKTFHPQGGELLPKWMLMDDMNGGFLSEDIQCLNPPPAEQLSVVICKFG